MRAKAIFLQKMALSLFSGCGGLDLGFEEAGFEHVASIERMAVCVSTLRANREWEVVHADVRDVDFARWRGQVQVLHGGVPCQPFSVSGRGLGEHDERNMWPEFVRAVRETMPPAIVAENVPGLLRARFADFVRTAIEDPIRALGYTLQWVRASAEDAGVPQRRARVFLIGFLDAARAERFALAPPANHVGARAALGLAADRPDGPVPTIKSAFSSPRLTSSIDTGKNSQQAWFALGLWPMGVQATPEAARQMDTPRDLHRLCTSEVKVLQGFPQDWSLSGSRCVQLAQLGNSVPPPLAARIAKAVREALL